MAKPTRSGGRVQLNVQIPAELDRRLRNMIYGERGSREPEKFTKVAVVVRALTREIASRESDRGSPYPEPGADSEDVE